MAKTTNPAKAAAAIKAGTFKSKPKTGRKQGGGAQSGGSGTPAGGNPF